MRTVRAVVLLVVLTGLTAGCGSSDNKATTSSATSAASSSTSAAETSSSTQSTGGSTTPVSVAVTHPTAHLVAVRAARQETVDRVVFEFSDRVPGYKVAYGKKPLVGTSGKEVPLAGSAALVVHMEQASGFNLDTGTPTYSGPQRLAAAGTRAVTEVVHVEDFEGVLNWAIGLNGEVPFRVSTLVSPPRMVVDIPS